MFVITLVKLFNRIIILITYVCELQSCIYLLHCNKFSLLHVYLQKPKFSEPIFRADPESEIQFSSSSTNLIIFNLQSCKITKISKRFYRI